MIKSADPKAMIIPWLNEEMSGPLDSGDIVYRNRISLRDLKKYIDLPSTVKQRGFSNGSTAFKIGINITTNLSPRTFVDLWNASKKTLIQNKHTFYACTLAEMQNSPTAFIIGLAAGSTENMDYEEINKHLQDVVGIKGIEVSFQNLYQPGITPDFLEVVQR